jgi:hypothetical protein
MDEQVSGLSLSLPLSFPSATVQTIPRRDAADTICGSASFSDDFRTATTWPCDPGVYVGNKSIFKGADAQRLLRAPGEMTGAIRQVTMLPYVQNRRLTQPSRQRYLTHSANKVGVAAGKESIEKPSRLRNCASDNECNECEMEEEAEETVHAMSSNTSALRTSGPQAPPGHRRHRAWSARALAPFSGAASCRGSGRAGE